LGARQYSLESSAASKAFRGKNAGGNSGYRESANVNRSRCWLIEPTLQIARIYDRTFYDSLYNSCCPTADHSGYRRRETGERNRSLSSRLVAWGPAVKWLGALPSSGLGPRSSKTF